MDITGLAVSTCNMSSLINNCHDIIITKFSLGPTTYVCVIDLQKLFKVNPKLRYFKVSNTLITRRCLLLLPLETIEEIVLESLYPQNNFWCKWNSQFILSVFQKTWPWRDIYVAIAYLRNLKILMTQTRHMNRHYTLRTFVARFLK